MSLIHKGPSGVGIENVSDPCRFPVTGSIFVLKTVEARPKYPALLDELELTFDIRQGRPRRSG